MATTKITEEQRAALQAAEGCIEVVDETTQRRYVLMDASEHRLAMLALKEQETHEAIQAGIDDLEAGRVVPFVEIDARIRARLGLPQRKP